jgi:anaerobic ribonucleoside-triphosphate reductase
MHIAKVQKRDGSIVDFDSDKIKQAIQNAMSAVNQSDEKSL